MKSNYDELNDVSRKLRLECLRVTFNSGMGHLGPDFSCLDILVTLYSNILNFPGGDLTHPDRDRFILSKGHAALALYATLRECFGDSSYDLDTFNSYDSALAGHPSNKRLSGIETSTGALGHGMPFAVGCALAARLTRSNRRVFVLVGDGELQEGSNWEAAMYASAQQLDNLAVIVDRNNLQQGRFIEEVNTLGALEEKWLAFGWEVRPVDGHDIRAITQALTHFPHIEGRPTCLVADTTKGKGVSFMENNPAWHHKVPNMHEYELALAELGERQ